MKNKQLQNGRVNIFYAEVHSRDNFQTLFIIIYFIYFYFPDNSFYFPFLQNFVYTLTGFNTISIEFLVHNGG